MKDRKGEVKSVSRILWQAGHFLQLSTRLPFPTHPFSIPQFIHKIQCVPFHTDIKGKVYACDKFRSLGQSLDSSSAVRHLDILGLEREQRSGWRCRESSRQGSFQFLPSRHIWMRDLPDKFCFRLWFNCFISYIAIVAAFNITPSPASFDQILLILVKE